MTLWELAEASARTLRDRFEEYEVIVGNEREIMLKLANGEPSVTQSWNRYTITVYVTKNGKIFQTSLSSTSPGEVLEKLDTILATLSPSPLYAPLPEPTGQDYENTDERVIEIVESGDLSRVSEDLELDQARNWAGTIRLAKEERVLVNSNKASLHGERTLFNGYMRVFADEDSSGQWSWTSTMYRPDIAKKAVGAAARLAEECSSLPKRKIESGNYRVLLSPMVAGNLLEVVARSASGGAILFGFSFFKKEDLEAIVASEKLTILDKPRDRELPGYSLFDDEGVATRDKPVIEKGVLKNILHNSKTAKLFGAKTTGNAGLLMPEPFNLDVAPGDLKDDEMLEALGDGLYITNNWYTRFQNYPEGLFSTVARDAVIIVEDGKPVGCTSRVRIADSMRRLLSNIEGVGATLWQIQWWEVSTPTRLPHILVSNARITSE